MRIDRPVRRRALPYLGCGCLALLTTCLVAGGIGLVLLLPALPGLALQAAGFQATGQTDSVFVAATPAPTVIVQNPARPTQVILEFGTYGSEALPPTLYDYSIAVGNDPTGGTVATLTVDEATLMALCVDRLDICEPFGNGQIRNARIDLRPGGAVITADVFVSQLASWQNLGAVLRLDNTGRQLVFAGIDLGGTLYSAPPAGMGLDNIGVEIERTANDILRQLVLNTGDGRYNLSRIQIDDASLLLVLN